MNVKYLNHDTYTDVITFDNSERGTNNINGDIFISIDRVKENAKTYGIPTYKELCRVLVHGTLHLVGYTDKSKSNKLKMT
jgi:probable rRNA maturation factor